MPDSSDSSASLAELQQHIARQLFSKPDGEALIPIRAEGTLDANQRLGIYRNSIRAIHLEHLKAVYPVCQQLLGTAFFGQLATDYIRHWPPDSPFLSDYGAQLADLIAQHKKLAQWRWIADIARLEWARHYAWHSPNPAATDWSSLATLDSQQQAGLCFRLLSSATLINSPWAIHQVWSAHQADTDEALEQINLHQGECVLVLRQGRKVIQKPLDQPMCTFLGYIQQGKTLAELTALQGAAVPDLLTRCIAQSWLY